MIIPCSCTHKAQDALHGVGNRVMNPTRKGSEGAIEYRCTACLRQHRIGADRAPACDRRRDVKKR